MKNSSQYKNMYNKLKTNSIGKEKKDIYQKLKKNIALKIGISTLTGSLLLTCLTGCNKDFLDKLIPETSYTQSEEQEHYNQIKNNGEFKIWEIETYAELRVNSLLYEYNYFDYVDSGNKRSYNYTAEQYKLIDKLDESYIYGFYLYTDQKTLNEVLKALGYNDLDDFLVKNEYIKNNQPNKEAWKMDCLDSTLKEMQEKIEKGKEK